MNEEEIDNRFFYATVTFILGFLIFHFFNEHVKEKARQTKHSSDKTASSKKVKQKSKLKKKKKKVAQKKTPKSQKNDALQQSSFPISPQQNPTVEEIPARQGLSTRNHHEASPPHQRTSQSYFQNQGTVAEQSSSEEEEEQYYRPHPLSLNVNKQTPDDGYVDKHYSPNPYAEVALVSPQERGFQNGSGATRTDPEPNEDEESSSSEDTLDNRLAILNSGKTIVADLGKKRPGGIKPTNKFNVDDVIEARFEGGNEFFPGKISKVGTNLTYSIQYDDGERETKVPEHFIRFKNSPVQPMEEFWAAPAETEVWETVPMPSTKDDRVKKKVVQQVKREEKQVNSKNRMKRAKKKEKEKLIREAMRKNL